MVPPWSQGLDAMIVQWSRWRANLTAWRYARFVHWVILVNHVVLGLPLPLLAFTFPSDKVRCNEFCRTIWPEHLNFLACMMVSRRFLLILLRTSLLVILSFHDSFIIFLYDHSRLCICSLTVFVSDKEFFVWWINRFREGCGDFCHPFYLRITFSIDYVNVSTRSMFVPSMLMLIVGLSNFLHVIIVLVFIFQSNVFTVSFCAVDSSLVFLPISQ